MRTYRVEAEPRATPDLHKLAQLFIGMARQRAEHARHAQDTPAPPESGEVESEL